MYKIFFIFFLFNETTISSKKIKIISTLALVSFLFYQSIKLESFDIFFKESGVINELDKENFDNLCLKFKIVESNLIIVGSCLNSLGLKKLQSLKLSYIESIIDLTLNIIGSWNKELEYSLKFKFLIDFEIASRNFSIYAIDKHVWIVGIARSYEEKQKIFKYLNDMKKNDEIKSYHFHIVIKKSAQDGFVVRHKY